MKKNLFVLIVLFFCYALLPSSSVALDAQWNLEDLVRDFYVWYIETSKDIHNVPTDNNVIYEYVYACTVNKLRIDQKQARIYSDYFLCGNDFSYEEFKKSLIVHNPVSLSDTISLVPVSVGFHIGKPNILVFVQKTKDGWRIIKVEDPFEWY